MVSITIDPATCKADGLCAAACPVGILKQDEPGGVLRVDETITDKCFACGQCVAICPNGAILHDGFGADAVHPVRKDLVPSYDQVLELVRSRRSRRLFRDQPVEPEQIEKILDAARFAPSGHNEQGTEFVVVQGQENIRDIARLTAKGMRKTASPFHSPVGRMIMKMALGRRGADYVGKLAPEMDHVVDRFEEGSDGILHNAPLLVLFCADRVGDFMAAINANIALHNAALAAEALGLGCFYTGFIVMAARRGDEIARRVSLPETHTIYGGLALGYPGLHFNKWPERNPAKVGWIGFDLPTKESA